MGIRRENIKAIEQHFKMPAGYFCRAARLWPLKPPECRAFQTFTPQGESRTVVVKHLKSVTPAIDENKQTAVQR